MASRLDARCSIAAGSGSERKYIMNTYGKTNLIDDLTKASPGITKKNIAMVLDAALVLIQEQMQKENKVVIPGFGS
jgi:hypothetical protein